MIKNWKQLHRMHSVQLAAIVACVAGLEAYLPALQGSVPPWAYAIASIAVIVARVIRQPSLQAPENVVQELKRVKAILNTLGKASIVVMLVGCAGREACYARNDAEFLEVVEDCDEEGFTYEECPWIPEAERVQKAKDGRCP